MELCGASIPQAQLAAVLGHRTAAVHVLIGRCALFGSHSGCGVAAISGRGEAARFFPSASVIDRPLGLTFVLGGLL